MIAKTGHILVVDDHKTNRLKMSMAVKKLGHTTDMAEDGRQALEMLRTEPFDLNTGFHSSYDTAIDSENRVCFAWCSGSSPGWYPIVKSMFFLIKPFG